MKRRGRYADETGFLPRILRSRSGGVAARGRGPVTLERQESFSRIAVAYAGLFLPLAILVATNMVNRGAEQRAAQEKCIEESIQLLDKQYDAAGVAPSVADERRTHFAAVADYTVQYCDKAGFKLPQVVTTTIAGQAAAGKGTEAGDSLSDTRDKANDITQGDGHGPAVPAAGAAVPVPGPAIRLFLQIVDEAQRPAALLLQQRLQQERIGGRPIVVPGIEKVGGGADNSLRCLKSNDCAMAPALAALVNAQLASPQVTVTNLSARFDKAVNVAPGTFELWLAPGDVRVKPAG